jgi:hypothetical protein
MPSYTDLTYINLSSYQNHNQKIVTSIQSSFENQQDYYVCSFENSQGIVIYLKDIRLNKYRDY